MQGFDGLPALGAQFPREIVDVEGNVLRLNFRRHFLRVSSNVGPDDLWMGIGIDQTFPNGPGHKRLRGVIQSLPGGNAPQRQGQPGLTFPPFAQIHQADQPKVWIDKAAFVNDDAGIVKPRPPPA